MFGLTDDELLSSILCDICFQYALGTTSYEEQPFSDRTFSLVEQLGEAFFELPEYQLLRRVLMEQTKQDENGKLVPKDKKNIAPDSLQNPSDPDVTYRSKAGKENKGYVGNLVETFGDNGAIITSYNYQVNSHSDSAFCREVIEKLGYQETPITIIADGAYGSIDNTELAQENNIELVTTALIGKTPDAIQAWFKIDIQNQGVIHCPAGKKPYKTRYYATNDTYRASFDKKACENCPYRERCGAKLQKKSAYVMISTKMVQRAEYINKLSTEQYRELSRKRNGVEGLPSILRRKYNVDHMPVRGYLRSKMWFSFKIGAINAKRLLKRVVCFSQSLLLSEKTNAFLFNNYVPTLCSPFAA